MFSTGSLQLSTGYYALVQVITYLFAIVVAWYALGSVKWDLFLRNYRGTTATMLRLIIAICLGFILGQFMLQYLGASLLLRYLRG